MAVGGNVDRVLSRSPHLMDVYFRRLRECGVHKRQFDDSIGVRKQRVVTTDELKS